MQRSPLILAALATLFASACKASNPEVPRRAMSEVSKAEPRIEAVPVSTQQSMPAEVDSATAMTQAVVARVGDREVYVSELLSAWMLTDSVGLRDMLENLVTSRLVKGEAQRLGIELSEEFLSAEFALALSELEADLQRNKPGMRLDEWIAGSLGLDPARYRLGIRDDVSRRLLAERVVRQFIYSQDWADVRVLVVESLEEAEAALVRLEGGEPFARVADEVSVDPSGKYGGRIPPVVRNNSAISRLTYKTEPGAFGGPLLEEVEGVKRWLVVKPEEFHEAIEGEWSEISEEIEASLKERPVTEPEYWLWKVEMSSTQPADFEPFFELIGDPSGTPRR